jgi:GNAT superfamily N-acetyltransferase
VVHGGPVADVEAAHWARLRVIDALLAEPVRLPKPAAGDAVLVVDGAAGLARRQQRDLGDLEATWGALDQWWLFARAAGPEAMARLLVRWREHLASDGPPTAGDSSLVLPWPSRDVALIKVFLAHGLCPDSVIAVRPAGRPEAPAAAPAGVRIRPAAAADLAAMVTLYMEQVRFGAQVSGMTERPTTAGLIRDRYAAVLATDPSWVWVAEQDGELVGLASVAVGERAAWIAPLVAATPVAYVDCMTVAAVHRGGGVAAALVRHLHAAVDEAGIAVTLLHYAALNPLSAPFWHRGGYRPLSTRWQLTPAR